jgi:hypothetical protein
MDVLKQYGQHLNLYIHGRIKVKKKNVVIYNHYGSEIA